MCNIWDLIGKMSKFVDLEYEKITSTLRRNFWRGDRMGGKKWYKTL